MEQRKSESKPGELALPAASHSHMAQTLYDWLQNEVENVDYGKVGIEFTIHQSQITRIQKTVVLSEQPK